MQYSELQMFKNLANNAVINSLAKICVLQKLWMLWLHFISLGMKFGLTGLLKYASATSFKISYLRKKNPLQNSGAEK